jgi:hypothetical protein
MEIPFKFNGRFPFHFKDLFHGLPMEPWNHGTSMDIARDNKT